MKMLFHCMFTTIAEIDHENSELWQDCTARAWLHNLDGGIVQKILTCCRIPVPYLLNTKKYLAPELPEAPLIVFINSKSGGHAGPQLTEVLYHTLGHAQVKRCP